MPFTIPTYKPPGSTQTDASPALQGYLATSNPGYYQEFTRHMNWVKENQPGNDNRTFATWFKDHLNTAKDDPLWQDDAIKGFLETGTFTAPETGGGGTTDEPPAPPAPDAPVQANGTLISAPTPTPVAPPVSDRSSEVYQAGRDARRAMKKRRGALSTFLAGETGGASSPVKTLLGL